MISYYTVEEGIYDPRDEQTNFRPYGEYAKITEAREASSNLRLFRLCRVQVIDQRIATKEAK